jgi:5-methylcytosine-specific restriction endonuclease McrA
MADTLLLNADAQPVSILPLSTITWQEAIRYMVLDKVEVMEWHDDWIVRSANWSTPVPAVIMLKEYQKPKNTMRLSKRNIFLRDQYVCQYCGTEVTEATATLDHVHPVSLGGKTTWENSTTACKPCNYKKAAHVGKFKPKNSPYKPHFWDLVEKRRARGFHIGHPSWRYYLEG